MKSRLVNFRIIKLVLGEEIAFAPFARKSQSNYAPIGDGYFLIKTKLRSYVIKVIIIMHSLITKLTQ